MAAKINVGDRVRVKSLAHFQACGKNPYFPAIFDTKELEQAIARVAGQESTVTLVHPAGFVNLSFDDGHEKGTFTYDMIELVERGASAPLVEPKTHPAGTEFPIQEAAITLMAGMLGNPNVIAENMSEERARKYAKNVLLLARALELELQ